MARPKKNGTYLNVCIETSIYKRLEKLCDEAGQTKTYFDEYDETQRIMNNISARKYKISK